MQTGIVDRRLCFDAQIRIVQRGLQQGTRRGVGRRGLLGEWLHCFPAGRSVFTQFTLCITRGDSTRGDSTRGDSTGATGGFGLCACGEARGPAAKWVSARKPQLS